MEITSKRKRNGDMFLRTAIAAVVASSFSSGAALAQEEEAAAEGATKLDAIEVTGSRLRRTDVEGSVPITTIDRQQIELSGHITVAELLRDTTFNSFGSFRPASGSSAQSLAEASLRGLGGGRTLVLLDGKRTPLEPSAPDAGSNLNAIPLAAVERVEILQDGASAIYGADAIGGVINIITRKDFSGVELQYGVGELSRDGGGDTREGSVLLGTSGPNARILAGASYNSRSILFARERPWSSGGASTFSNNYREVVLDPISGAPSAGAFIPGDARVPGGCAINELFFESDTRCFYDFSQISADEASIENTSLYTRAAYDINPDWSVNFNASVARLQSFGRYAPTPEHIFVPANTPNNPFDRDLFISHRFAALGPRDDNIDNVVYDGDLFVNGSVAGVEVEFGLRRSDSSFKNNGRNYVNIPIAQQLFASGDYVAADPFSSDPSVLDAVTVSISRDGKFSRDSYYGSASTNFGMLPGGPIAAIIGFEYFEEDYADVYDQASETGNVGGSAGNSAAGTRRLKSGYTEVLFPVLQNLEFNAALRYDDYSDFGDSTSPKISFRYQPLDTLTLRGSWGEGFRAPPLPYLTQNTAFSADTVVDPQTAAAFGLDPSTAIQINAFRIANPDLEAEESKQYSLGFAVEPTDWVNFAVDYYNIEVEDRITFFDSPTLLARENDPNLPTPPGLGVTRNPDGSIFKIDTGYGNEGKIKTSGLDFNGTLQFSFGDLGRFKSNLQFTRVLEYDLCSGDGACTDIVEASPEASGGGPEYRTGLQNVYTWRDLSFAFNIQYIPSFKTFLGDVDAGDFGGTEGVPACAEFGEPCRTDSLTLLDVQLSYALPTNTTLTIGMDNLTDEDPILDGFTTRGYVTELSDPYGRMTYFRVTQRF